MASDSVVGIQFETSGDSIIEQQAQEIRRSLMSDETTPEDVTKNINDVKDEQKDEQKEEQKEELEEENKQQDEQINTINSLSQQIDQFLDEWVSNDDDCNDFNAVCKLQCAYKGMQDLKNLAQDIRAEVTKMKNGGRRMLQDKHETEMNQCTSDCDQFHRYCRKRLHGKKATNLRTSRRETHHGTRRISKKTGEIIN